MKQGKFTFEGKEFEYVYPEGLEQDLTNQIPEIFKQETYKLGRRKKEAVYLDVGGNIGSATRYFYPYAKQIYTIEPNPDIYKALVENTKNLPNVKTFNLAIGHRNGNDYMYSNSGSKLPQSFYGNGESTLANRVKVMALDEFLEENNINHVDVMKIDVESAEYIIFPSESFKRASEKIDFIIGESHYQDGGGFPDLIPLMLNEYGYETSFVELNKPNFLRVFTYYDEQLGTWKKYTVPYNTIFVAEKRK